MRALIRRHLTGFALLAALHSTLAAPASPASRVDPPNWWVGMRHEQLELMLNGPHVAEWSPNVNVPGVRIVATTPSTNPNDLWITLDIQSEARAGALPVTLRQGAEATTWGYELRAREPGSAQRAGFGALRLAGKYPQRFAASAGHSSITEAQQFDALMTETRAGWSAAPQDRSVLAALTHAAAPLPPLRFDCGLDDPFLTANRALHRSLAAAGIGHEYCEHPGGHDWSYWSLHLEDTLRFFAKTLKAMP